MRNRFGQDEVINRERERDGTIGRSLLMSIQELICASSLKDFSLKRGHKSQHFDTFKKKKKKKFRWVL